MPVTQITYQPEINSLNASYRPIIFRCKAKIPVATVDVYAPTVVYCDIYVNNVYYKSLSRTASINDDGIAPEYEFDIQDTMQEIMTVSLPQMNGSIVEDHSGNLKSVFVRFRNSYLDSNGFNKSEQLPPIQGTSSSNPVAGEGLQSNVIVVLNCVIQHEENQNLKLLLQSYKTGEWNSESLPLTKRPKIFNLCYNDSSHFPLITDSDPAFLFLNFKTAFASAQLSTEINNLVSGKKLLYIPEGLINFKEVFPLVDFNEIIEWSVSITDIDENIIATSRKNKVGCCCGDDKIRIHFLNSCGQIDSINFQLVSEENETKSDSWEKSQKFPLNRSSGGTYRKNITSNENYEVETKCYGEKDQYWIKELSDTPLAWLEMFLPNGFNEPVEKEFIPITILDSKLPTKIQDAFEYNVRLKFSMSNANVNLR